MSRHLKILLVDDDEVVREVLTELLEDRGYQVFSASTGVGALDLARSIRVDVLLADYNMPGMNGLELARRLQQAGLDPEEIFIVTGLGGEQYDDLVAVASAIGVRVFPKPTFGGLWEELAAMQARCPA